MWIKAITSTESTKRVPFVKVRFFVPRLYYFFFSFPLPLSLIFHNGTQKIMCNHCGIILSTLVS